MAVPLRRVLVTGGNKGIGLALCKQLCRDQGFHVLLGSRDAGRGEEAIGSILKEAPQCDGRIELLRIDTSEDASVATAAENVAAKFGTDPAPLYGVVNNAGVGFGRSMADTLAVNTYGPKRVSEAFLPLLCPSTGRIVNIASASGPMYVAGCPPEEAKVLTDPAVMWEQIEALISRALSSSGREAYGFSKACLNAYTVMLAREHPSLCINSCTPGFILTDITRGMGATKSPDEGTKAAIHCLTADLKNDGLYYGSDAVRSPLDRYRGPGDPPYKGP